MVKEPDPDKIYCCEDFKSMLTVTESDILENPNTVNRLETKFKKERFAIEKLLETMSIFMYISRTARDVEPSGLFWRN